VAVSVHWAARLLHEESLSLNQELGDKRGIGVVPQHNLRKFHPEQG
jgi:hypothetical protein